MPVFSNVTTVTCNVLPKERNDWLTLGGEWCNVRRDTCDTWHISREVTSMMYGPYMVYCMWIHDMYGPTHVTCDGTCFYRVVRRM